MKKCRGVALLEAHLLVLLAIGDVGVSYRELVGGVLRHGDRETANGRLVDVLDLSAALTGGLVRLGTDVAACDSSGFEHADVAAFDLVAWLRSSRTSACGRNGHGAGREEYARKMHVCPQFSNAGRYATRVVNRA